MVSTDFLMQTNEDKIKSKDAHKAIGNYFRWKYEADKDLHGRTTFKWTIVRPTFLTNDLGAGKVTIGRTHLGDISVRKRFLILY